MTSSPQNRTASASPPTGTPRRLDGSHDDLSEDELASTAESVLYTTAGNGTISVITPTRLDPDRLPWLYELNQSLASAGIEHVVVVDGDLHVPFGLLAKVIVPGRQVGQAAARNLGLEAATGDYITSADDDDIVPVAGLLKRASILDQNPMFGWAAGYLADVTPDGERLGVWVNKASVGINLPGDVFQSWDSPDGEFPIAPTGLMVRREVLIAEGGWGGLPQAEDFCMALRVTGRHSGELVPEVVYEYRKHLGQMMQQDDFDRLEGACRRFCFRMAEAISLGAAAE